MSVLFVQPTENSLLKKKYEEVRSKSECSERAGASIKSKVQKSYPFPKSMCEDRCFVSMSDGKGNSRRCNVSYEVVMHKARM